MAERTKRRRLSSRTGPKRNQITNESEFPGDPLVLAAESDRGTWNGFCEIESEPVRSSPVQDPPNTDMY